MAVELINRYTPPHLDSIERAILETLAYSDVFDYPLRVEEIHRYLAFSITLSELIEILEHRNEYIKCIEGYYVLSGREHLLAVRRDREITSRKLLQRAFRYGRSLGYLPFIRMVGLTGSLALQNCDKAADIDYFLVAADRRVWLARAFALLFGRITALFGHTLCPNLIISEKALEWQQQDLYSAHELCQMIPISGIEFYAHLRQANSWTNSFLPNASTAPLLGVEKFIKASRFRIFYERPLRGKIGDCLENWEMNRKISRFKALAGYGPETHFSRDICQGNFDHHGIQTREAFQHRLSNLGFD